LLCLFIEDGADTKGKRTLAGGGRKQGDIHIRLIAARRSRSGGSRVPEGSGCPPRETRGHALSIPERDRCKEKRAIHANRRPGWLFSAQLKISEAVDSAGIQYLTDYEGRSPKNLDFYLPDHDLYLEVKGGHSERISNQMARDFNVIAIQGIKSVAFVVKLLLNK
jgi:hypothetical protein